VSEREFRPRLSDKEISFILELMKFAEHFLDSQEKNYKSLESRLYELRKEVRIGNTTVWRELKATKEQLAQLNGFPTWTRENERLAHVVGLPMWIYQQRSMLRRLTHRFESILNGGKAHRHRVYDFELNQALSKVMVPKTL